jgi:hypothetical protein
LQGFEATQGRLGGTLAVFARGGQGQQQFDDLVILKSVQPGLEKPFAKATTVSGAFVSPIFGVLCHRLAA